MTVMLHVHLMPLLRPALCRCKHIKARVLPKLPQGSEGVTPTAPSIIHHT